MAETARQKRIAGRVMHEFKHGELKSGRGGKGGKVRSRRQAIAIALNEAGDSRYESERRNRRNLRRTERKEREGRTGQQEREGKSHLGAHGERESTRTMGGKNAEKRTARGRKAATTRARRADGHTRKELYARARRRDIAGRSKMRNGSSKTPSAFTEPSVLHPALRPSLRLEPCHGVTTERPEPVARATADPAGPAAAG